MKRWEDNLLVFTLENFAKKLNGLGVDEQIINKVIEGYKKVKKEYLSGNYEEVVRYAGKFCEAILALIESKVSGRSNLDKIRMEQACKRLESYPKSNAKDEILLTALPRVARSVYTLRNKENVAHVKTVDPKFIDAVYCVTACDWMLSRIALLLLNADEKEVYDLINSILKKKIPLIEEFEDGTIVILKKDLSRSDEILLTLYHYYPQRLSNSELENILKLPPKSVYTYLQRLENERLIHRTENGNKLTLLGIKYVEENLVMKQEKSSTQ
ncbi:MAG: hypothetical protein QXM13_04480 [Candidatus Bathyarchaeia archaeon]